LISHHESANQTRGKRLDTCGSCPTFTGLTMPLLCAVFIAVFWFSFPGWYDTFSCLQCHL